MLKQSNEKELYFNISALADALNVHQRTLRIYDAEGVLCARRTEKNRRTYTLDDLERGKCIKFLTANLAMNLAGVKIIFAMLEANKVKPKDYLNYINKAAKFCKIDETKQAENIAKTSKRGRKAKLRRGD